MLLKVEKTKKKRVRDKRAYKIIKLKIIQTTKNLKNLILSKSFFNVNDLSSRRRFRVNFTKNQIMKNDEQFILKRSRFTKKFKNFDIYKSKNIREFQN